MEGEWCQSCLRGHTCYWGSLPPPPIPAVSIIFTVYVFFLAALTTMLKRSYTVVLKIWHKHMMLFLQVYNADWDYSCHLAVKNQSQALQNSTISCFCASDFKVFLPNTWNESGILGSCSRAGYGLLWWLDLHRPVVMTISFLWVTLLGDSRYRVHKVIVVLFLHHRLF